LLGELVVVRSTAAEAGKAEREHAEQVASLCTDSHIAGAVVDRIEVDASDHILYVELILHVIRDHLRRGDDPQIIRNSAGKSGSLTASSRTEPT
jgi:hypothetical protein